MSMQVWPFLVTRNQTFEYRVVIAPQFIYDTRQSSLLREALEERITPDGQAFYREISNPDHKDITVVFRVEMAREHHLGLDTDDLLYDQQHRPIYFTEGLVFEGIGLDITVNKEIFEDIHQLMQERYKMFWDGIDSPPVTFSSDCMIVEIGDDDAKYLQLHVLSPQKIASSHSPSTSLELPVPSTKLAANSKQDKEAASSSEQGNKGIPLLVGASIAAAVAVAGFLFIKNVR